jgi:hypothetical protein
MQAKSIKIGWVLMLILGLYQIAFSVIAVQDVSVVILMATNGVAIMGISLGSYRRAERWSWWCLHVIGLMPLLSFTILHGVNPWFVVGWILFIPAITVPAKAILGKKSTSSLT